MIKFGGLCGGVSVFCKERMNMGSKILKKLFERKS